MLPAFTNLPPVFALALALALSFAPNVVALPSVPAVAPTSLPSPRPIGVDLPKPNPTGASEAGPTTAAAAFNPDPFLISVAMNPPSTTTTTVTSSPTASPPSAPHPGSPTAEHPTECRLLGSFAILVQLALGGLALLSLVYKRWRERPQRPVKIWFFDVSKQVFGSVLVHAANVFMSLLTSGRFSVHPGVVVGVAAGRVVKRAAAGLATAAVVLLGGRAGGGGAGEGNGGGGHGNGDGDAGQYVPNPCSFYLLNLAIDTTLGIPILIVIVRVLTRLVAFTPLGQPPESIQSGNYGSPPNAWWWLKQSVIYFCGLMGMKFCVLILFMMLPWLPHVGDWALGWTEGNEKVQIVFVMMLFPLIMNALQYYIIDSYIKKQEAFVDGEAGAAAGEIAVYEELVASGTESDDDDDEDVQKDAGRTGAHPRLARRDSAGSYVDGDSQTVIGSSSSRISSRGALPKELIPAE